MNTAIEERIRNRAYELWEAEGRPEGREVDHWLRAAQELADQQERAGAEAARARKPRSAPAAPAKKPATTTAKRTATTTASGSRSRAPKRTAPLS